MEFDHQAQEDLYARVASYLRHGFGELAEPLGDDPAFLVELGSVRLLVMVDAAGPDKSGITILNRLGDGLPITPDLAVFLLHKNYEIPFGSISLNEDDEIVIAHILFGETATKETLAIALRVFGSTCEALEDELNMVFR